MLRACAFVTALVIPAVAGAQQPCTPDARRVVNEIYRVVLERPADRNAERFVQQLASGERSVREIVHQIAISPEHTQRFGRGSSDADRRNAVRALYRHVLGREADPGGLDAHLIGLRDQGVAAVVEAMQNSDEYQQKFGADVVPGTQVRFCDDAVGLDTANRMGRRFRNMDTNRDGQVTRNEWRGNARAFQDNDWNGDGVLSGDEVLGNGNAAGRAVGTAGTFDDAAATFDSLDRNENGRIERSEWSGTAAEFNRLDTNQNNLLSRAEIASRTAAADDFDEWDSNGDGRLTIQEWNWNRRSFEQQDTNGDGSITRGEFRGQPGNDPGR